MKDIINLLLILSNNLLIYYNILLKKLQNKDVIFNRFN